MKTLFSRDSTRYQQCYHSWMRQLITRISDDLHARLKKKAKAEGKSVNAVVTEVIEAALDSELTPAQRLRKRAKELGILAEVPQLDEEPTMSRDDFIESTKGMGPFLSEILEQQRRREWER